LKATDTLHVVMSDMHTGSIYALTQAGAWQGQKTAIIHPTSRQQKIRKQFELYAAAVKDERKGIKVRLIIDGDNVDGIHHSSGDVFTSDPLEMADVNIQLISEFQKRINWQRGDELYIVKGTEIHTRDFENYIGEQLGAVMDGQFYAYELLQLNTNGVISWFTHHGPNAGDGHNEGNNMMNFLKRIYYNAIKNRTVIPDILYTAHVHNPTYSTFCWHDMNVFKTMHGIILPSWQLKTRYAHMVAPVSLNKIGGVSQRITADGVICVPKFYIMDGI
jgi:hypothetical protein